MKINIYTADTATSNVPGKHVVLPIRGTASDVGGIVSATSRRNTVNDNSIVTPENAVLAHTYGILSLHALYLDNAWCKRHEVLKLKVLNHNCCRAELRANISQELFIY